MMGNPPAPEGPPPGLLAMLTGQGGPDAGPPPDVAGQPDGDEQEPIAILKQMIELGGKYITVENDAADKATMAKLIATLHQYLAKDQSDAEAALGGGSGRMLRKLG